MEWVSIQEASRLLNVSKDVIRRYVREGRLEGKREPNATGGQGWVVQLPEAGWEDDFKHHIHGIAQQVTPWWRPNPRNAGPVHYVESLGIEEVKPMFLCGLVSEDFWPAVGHDVDDRCPKCLEEVTTQGLPMETRE